MKRLCALAFLVLVSGCVETSEPARPQEVEAPANVRDLSTAGESPNSLIAFGTGDGIITMAPDGSQRTNITGASTRSPSAPQWSPDGSSLVFICYFGEADEIQELCIIDRDGTNLQRLTESAGGEFSPDWSPNGRWIAFARASDRTSRIFRVRPDGSGEQLIPNTRNSGHLGWRHHRRIVFARGSVDGGDIYTIRRDGTGRRRLTFPHDGADDEPQWSPDGNRIVFMRLTDVATFDIFKMAADGSRVRRLTHRCCSAAAPAWSPNGRTILFLDDGLRRMKANGSGVRRVPNARDAGPADWTAN